MKVIKDLENDKKIYNKAIDDVVKQLEDKKQFIATRAFCQQIPQEYCNDRNCFHCCVDYLINIVKAGGIGE